MKKIYFLKIKIISMIIIIFILFIHVSPSNAFLSINQLNKQNQGNILYVGGNGDSNYTNIQDAINISDYGDTIYVYSYSSPYNENITIEKSIKLIGENKEDTIIQTSKKIDVIYINSDNVELTGFTITHYDQIPTGCAGIRLLSDNNKIYGNTIENNDYGLCLAHSNENNIYDNNVINNSFFGVDIMESNSNEIFDCTVKNSVNGFAIFRSSYNKIINNSLINNKRGLDLYYSSYNDVMGNTIDGNNNHCFGLGLFWGSSTSGCSSYNTIHKNKLINNLAGIVVMGKPENDLTNNIISENLIKDNQCGIQLLSYTSNNQIYHNNFVNNINPEENTPNNAFDCTNNIWDNGQEGNYWSDYKEQNPDAKPRNYKPWIWNKAYVIKGNNNKDRYPLINEWKTSNSRCITINNFISLIYGILNNLKNLNYKSFKIF